MVVRRVWALGGIPAVNNIPSAEPAALRGALKPSQLEKLQQDLTQSSSQNTARQAAAMQQHVQRQNPDTNLRAAALTPKAHPRQVCTLGILPACVPAWGAPAAPSPAPIPHRDCSKHGMQP